MSLPNVVPLERDAARPADRARVPARRPWSLARVAPLLVAAVALAAMASSLGNGFAYDDGWIVVGNKPLHTLNRWWTLFVRPYWLPEFGARLYRPLTSLAFALQWAAGGGSALPFHAVNVALYVALCAAVLALLRRTDDARRPFGAVAAAALFAAHPIHVEAVANVVGQAELWVALLLVLAVSAYVRWRREGPLGRGRVAALLAGYAAVCLVKENGIVLPALLALAEWLLVHDDRPRKKRIASLRELLLAMTLVAVATLFMRSMVLDSVSGDDPHPAFVGMPGGARRLAMLALVPRVAGMLLWPARLLADYSPGDTPLRTTLGPWHLLGATLVAALLGLAAWCRTRRPAVTFGVLWMVVALGPVANVIVPTGIVLAERSLLLPSVGFVIVIGALLAWAAERTPSAVVHRAGAFAVAALVVAGAARSAMHAPVWKNNTTLFTQLVHDAPLNGRAHYSYGGILFDRGDWEGGVREWNRAIELLPSNRDAAIALAQRYLERSRPLDAMRVLEAEIRREPTVPLPRLMHVAAQLRMARFSDARREALEGAKASHSPIAFQFLVAVVDSVLIRSPSGDSIGLRAPPPNAR